VQVGDICYDSAAEIYYYCRDATPGAADWVAFGGGPPPPGPDHQFPAIIVGNALAGDTTDVCDILDPGDGTGLQSALTTAAYGTIGNFAQDVYARPGVYGPATFNVPAGVRLLGAGRGRTILSVADGLTSVDLDGDGGELADVTIAVNTANLSGVGDARGYITVACSDNTTSTPFAIRRVNLDIIVYDPFSIASANLVGILVRANNEECVLTGHKIHDVRVAYLGAGYNSQGGALSSIVRGLSVAYSTFDPSILPVEIDVRNCTSISMECGFATFGPALHLDRCVSDGTAMRAFSGGANTFNFGFYIDAQAHLSTLDACIARQSLDTSCGFAVVGSSGPTTPNPTKIALNSCYAWLDPTAEPALTATGFFLFTINSGVVLQGVRLYACMAETWNRGYVCTPGVQNTMGIGNVSVGNVLDISDSGTGNDFGHLQTL